MALYRFKEPVEAVQWDGVEENLLPGMDFWMPKYHNDFPGYYVKIDGVRVRVHESNWLITLPNGELRVFTDEDFKASYELVLDSEGRSSDEIPDPGEDIPDPMEGVEEASSGIEEGSAIPLPKKDMKKSK